MPSGIAVDAAERMAGVQVESVIVNVTGGRLGVAALQRADRRSAAGRFRPRCPSRARGRAARTERQGRAVLHSLPTGFSLDGTRSIRDPKGMMGDELGADMHVVGCDAAAARNLMLAVERCHLTVEAMVATPYAAGLAASSTTRPNSEPRLSTWAAARRRSRVFAGGHLVHVDGFAVGGNHVTMDIARGLTIRLADAERLEDALWLLHRLAVRRTRDDRRRPGRRGCRAVRPICRNRSSCGSSGRASRRFSNSCATG